MGPLLTELINDYPNDMDLGKAVRDLGKGFEEAKSPHFFSRLSNKFPNDRELGNIIRINILKSNYE